MSTFKFKNDIPESSIGRMKKHSLKSSTLLQVLDVLIKNDTTAKITPRKMKVRELSVHPNPINRITANFITSSLKFVR